MFWSKLIFWIVFFNITLTEQGRIRPRHSPLIALLLLLCLYLVPMQCSTSFMTGNDTNLCYYYRKRTLSWIDAYNHCLTRTRDGILIQIFSHEQNELVKTANIDQASVFWLGANNFASCKLVKLMRSKEQRIQWRRVHWWLVLTASSGEENKNSCLTNLVCFSSSRC